MAGLNINGCHFIVIRGRSWQAFLTLDALRAELWDAINVDCGPHLAGAVKEAEVGAAIDWAETAKPGAAQAFYDAEWIFTALLSEDRANIDFSDWEAGVTLGFVAPTEDR